MLPVPGTNLSQRGYGIPKDGRPLEELDAIKKELTVQPVVNQAMLGNVQPPTFRLYMESSKKLYVPKYYGLCKYGVPEAVTVPEGADLDLAFRGSLRDEQRVPMDKFLKACKDPMKMGGIISISCGGGKTVLGLYAVAALRKKTMIIVHKDFLLGQWKERIEEFLPDARVGLIKAKTIDVQDKDIVIASLQSLSMKDYDKGVFADIGFVIIDEVHRTGTEVFSNALHKINFRYALGLSATVQRKDGLAKVFKWFIGDVVYKKKRTEDGVLVKVCHFYDPDPIYSKEEVIYNGKLNLSRMINNVCDFHPRVQYIVDIIKRVMTESEMTRKILILSDRKAHLASIKELLEHQAPHITSGFYIGGMKQADLKESETRHIILATFSFASEGFDAKDLDTLILASPKTDIEQSVGRILRQRENERKHQPIIFDVVDRFSMFERQGKKRLAYYKKLKYVVSTYLDRENADEDEDGDVSNESSSGDGKRKPGCLIVDEDDP